MKTLSFILLSVLFQMLDADILDPQVLLYKSGVSRQHKFKCHVSLTDSGLYQRGELFSLVSQFHHDTEMAPHSYSELNAEQYDKIMHSNKDEKFVYDRYNGENFDGSAIQYTLKKSSDKPGMRVLIVEPYDLEKYRKEYRSSFKTTIYFKGSLPVSYKLEYYRQVRIISIFVKAFEDTCDLEA